MSPLLGIEADAGVADGEPEPSLPDAERWDGASGALPRHRWLGPSCLRLAGVRKPLTIPDLPASPRNREVRGSMFAQRSIAAVPGSMFRGENSSRDVSNVNSSPAISALNLGIQK